jgi:hypothetical protein
MVRSSFLKTFFSTTTAPLRVQKSEHKVDENEEFRLVMMLNFNMVHYVRDRHDVI